MPGRSLDDRIAQNEERIRQLEAQTRALKAQQSEKARKERTHMLIQMGGIMAALGMDLASVQELQREAQSRPQIREYLDKLLTRAAQRRTEQGEPEAGQAEAGEGEPGGRVAAEPT